MKLKISKVILSFMTIKLSFMTFKIFSQHNIVGKKTKHRKCLLNIFVIDLFKSDTTHAIFQRFPYTLQYSIL